jgi:hypothetical protein
LHRCNSFFTHGYNLNARIYNFKFF